ncbi:MAG: alpha/beta hydrolase [Nevskia sp.]
MTLWLLAALLLLRQALLGLRGSLLPEPAVVALGVVLILLQLFFEGWRKPVLPAAAALLLLALLPLLLQRLQSPADGLGGKLGLVAATLLLAASTVATWLHPALRYPTPGGPYRTIGVTTLPPAGVSPPGDVPTPDELQHPPALVKLWYPARPARTPGRFDRRRLAERLARFGERGRVFDDPAIVEAPPLDLPGGAAPLLFYLPGWPGVAIESAALVRELVSHGYYVATIEYPAPLPGMSAARRKALLAELERPLNYGSEAIYREMIEVSKERVRSRARDVSAALDRLTALAAVPGNPLAGRYEPSHAGIVGFSLGGAAAVQTANRDARFVTAINLDGRAWAEARTQGANKPMLLINEELGEPDPALLNSPDSDIRYNAVEDRIDEDTVQANLARHGGLRVIIAGTEHFNFTDLCLTSPLRRLSHSGTIAPRRGYEIVYAYALAWFDRSLRGRPSPLLDTTVSPYPEVIRVNYWPAPSAAPE